VVSSGHDRRVTNQVSGKRGPAQLRLGIDGAFSNFPDVVETILGRDAINGKHPAKAAANTYRRCMT
jgi:hypothetical protein